MCSWMHPEVAGVPAHHLHFDRLREHPVEGARLRGVDEHAAVAGQAGKAVLHLEPVVAVGVRRSARWPSGLPRLTSMPFRTMKRRPHDDGGARPVRAVAQGPWRHRGRRGRGSLGADAAASGSSSSGRRCRFTRASRSPSPPASSSPLVRRSRGGSTASSTCGGPSRRVPASKLRKPAHPGRRDYPAPTEMNGQVIAAVRTEAPCPRMIHTVAGAVPAHGHAEGRGAEIRVQGALLQEVESRQRGSRAAGSNGSGGT